MDNVDADKRQRPIKNQAGTAEITGRQFAGETVSHPGPGSGGINNVFAPIVNQKSLSSFSTPLILVTSFNYQVPRIGPNAFTKRVLGDWNVGGLLRYGSGALIAVPSSNDSLNSLIFRLPLATSGYRKPERWTYVPDSREDESTDSGRVL